jgi:hypothetical protein
MRFHRVIPVILMLGSWATSSARAQPGSPAPFASEPILAEAAAGAVMAFGMSLGMARLGSELLGPKGGEDPGLAGALAGVLLLPAVPIDLDRAGTWVAIFAVPTATAVIASSLGSSSRTVRPSARALRNGIGVGVELAF